MKSIIAASIALGIAGGLYAARRPAVRPIVPVARQDASAGLVGAFAVDYSTFLKPPAQPAQFVDPNYGMWVCTPNTGSRFYRMSEIPAAPWGSPGHAMRYFDDSGNSILCWHTSDEAIDPARNARLRLAANAKQRATIQAAKASGNSMVGPEPVDDPADVALAK